MKQAVQPRMEYDMKAILEKAASYPMIFKHLTWIEEIASSAQGNLHPLIRILYYNRVGKTDPYLSELDSDLSVLQGVPNVSKVCLRMKNYDQFLDERPSLHFAAQYKLRDFEVEFIAESDEKRPDFLIRDPKSGARVIFEVKHISGKTSLEPLILEVQDLRSPYIVSVYTDKLELEIQAINLARRIEAEIEKLLKSPAKISYAERHVVDLGYCRFEIFSKQSDKNGNTGVMLTWGGPVGVQESIDRVARVVRESLPQLVRYDVTGLNVIVLEDDALLHQDVVQDALYSTPGLLKDEQFEDVSAVKYVKNTIPRQEFLFLNQNNMHVKNGTLASLSL